MPLPSEIATLINAHLPNGARASNVYQRLADDCRALGFEGISHWLAANSTEEHEHLQRMIDFLSAYDMLADVPARESEPKPAVLPADRYAYIQAVFQGYSDFIVDHVCVQVNHYHRKRQNMPKR